MIRKEYVLLMARYNTWQNNQLRSVFKVMEEAELTLDRGAFFGSIFGTMNHILWGDTMWMSRFCKDVPPPSVPGPLSAEFTPSYGVWDAERFRLDGRLRIWAQALSNMDMHGDESWFSGAMNQQVTQPKAVCVAHVFNHQTHHRGQMSQMLKAAGQTPAVSDIIFMPEDA